MKFKTKDITALKESVIKAGKITLITHLNPDGDAVGSCVALYHYFKILMKDILIIIPNTPPANLLFILKGTDYIIAEKDFKSAKKRFAQTDLILITDMNANGRAGENIEKILNESEADKILIDHHISPEKYPVVFSYPEASSTCEVVWHVLHKLSGKKVFTQEISSALYLGIITDTGSFSYSCNNPELYIVISNLLKSGIKANKINQSVFDTYSNDKLQLLGYAINQKMRVFPDKRAAFIYISAAELKKFNYKPGDLEGVVNYCLKLECVDFCALLSERDNKIRMSFRSKDESIDVNKFASKYWNGGGHVMASGGKSYDTLDNVVKKLTEQINKRLFLGL